MASLYIVAIASLHKSASVLPKLAVADGLALWLKPNGAPMLTICFAATKGGCSKTTLAASLSTEASRKHKVAILDLDPQQSLARWHEIRVREVGDIAHPALLPYSRTPDRTLAKAAGDGFDYVIVDSPPGSVKHTVAAMALADLTVIPVRPSPIDVEAVTVMVELCREHGCGFVFALTGTTPRSSMTTGARQYLKPLGDVLDVEMANRQSYASAMILGNAAPENDPAARAEIAALWIAIIKRLAAKQKLARKKG